MQSAIDLEQAKKDAGMPNLSPELMQQLAALSPLQPEYWNTLWGGMQQASRTLGQIKECWQNWDTLEQARLYWQRHAQQERHNSRVIELLAEVQPSWRVLDIGAGPGTLALPLAEKAAQVTAVEPASGMAQVLHENIAEAGLDNVSVIQKRWDDVEITQDLVGAYDLVIVSFAFGMLDLIDTIEKIRKVASNRVVFYWHAAPMARDVDAVQLWPLLHGKQFIPIPKANIIFNLLYSMGIYADVQVMPRAYTETFVSMEAAVDEYCKRYDVQHTDAQAVQKLRHYLEHSLVSKDGAYVPKAHNTGMKISWTVGATD